MEQNNEKQKERSWKRQLILGAILIISFIAIFGSYHMVLLNSGMKEKVNINNYNYHFALITENKSTPFWNDVYWGAAQTAKEQGAYVEVVGDGLMEEFTLEECIDIAIYEKVDGILIQPEERESVQNLIDKAEAGGIPVITMQKDVPASGRQGFVGTNDYFLGQEYGRRVLKIADENTQRVTILIPDINFNEISREWFKNGISRAIEDRDIKLDIYVIQDDNGLNNAEEVVHSILNNANSKPDIMICLDPVITQTAYQVAMAYEMSDEMSNHMDIIGYYVSEAILAGIQQGGIDSTITMDSRQLGQLGVEALLTYKKHHMVSYYTAVDSQVVDRYNASAYQTKFEKEVTENEVE